MNAFAPIFRKICRTLPVASVAVALTSLVSVASADGHGHDGRFYAGAGIGYLKVDKDVFCDFEGTGKCDTKSSTWGVFGGYQINDHFSVEVGASKADTSVKVADGMGADQINSKLQLDSRFYNLGGVAYFPVLENTDVFGKAGVSWWKLSLKGSGDNQAGDRTYSVNESTDGVAPYIGLGARHMFNENMGVRGEWTFHKVGDDDDDFIGEGLVHYGMLSLLYMF